MDEVIVGQKLTDVAAMALAIKVAAKGAGRVSPNPAVGCVVLDRLNQLLSVGYHEYYGGPHAEVNALKGLAREQLMGARLFVTLEPCAHFGKTPPCADLISTLPLGELIFGLEDPNPLVKGQGILKIQAAGIKVTHFEYLRSELEGVCEHFLKNMKYGKPFVSLKVACSLDGKIALKNGESKWITGEESRMESHALRARHDAVLVGVQTFLADNPALNIRHPGFNEKKNKVIVIDPMARATHHISKSQLFQVHAHENILWILGANAASDSLEALGIPFIKVSSIAGKEEILDLSVLTSELWRLGFRSLLIEGGAKTMSAFIDQKIADRLYLFVAPIIVGEVAGLGWTSSLHEIGSLSEASKMSSPEVSKHGNDLLLSSRFL